MVYHEKALHNFYRQCHRTYSGQNIQCDLRAVHDGKVEFNTVKYKAAFLYSDWLYFLWRGIKIHISYKKQKLTPAEIGDLVTWVS